MSQTQTSPDMFEIGGDMRVHRLGFGAMRITGPGVWGPPADRDAAVDVVRRAVELGVDLIDTADSYGPGVSEELVAQALRDSDQSVLVATKGGLRRPGPDEWVPACDPARLKRCCDESLQRLGVEQIDLYQLHTSGDASVPYEDSVQALADLQREGKIRHVGISNVDVAHIKRARALVDVVTVQNRYNLQDRESEDVLDYCEREGIGFIPWFPLRAGTLVQREGAVTRVARELNASAPQVALAWLLRRSPVILPIPGTGSIEHLEENLGARSIQLSDEQFRSIDDESLAQRRERSQRPV